MLHSLHHIVTVHHLGSHHVLQNVTPTPIMHEKKTKKMEGFKKPHNQKVHPKIKKGISIWTISPPWLWLSKLAKNVRKNLSRSTAGGRWSWLGVGTSGRESSKSLSELLTKTREKNRGTGRSWNGSWWIMAPPLKRFKKGTFRRVFDFVAVDLGWHSNNVFFFFSVDVSPFPKGKELWGSGWVEFFFAKGWFKSKGRISYSNSICYCNFVRFEVSICFQTSTYSLLMKHYQLTESLENILCKQQPFWCEMGWGEWNSPRSNGMLHADEMLKSLRSEEK